MKKLLAALSLVVLSTACSGGGGGKRTPTEPASVPSAPSAQSACTEGCDGVVRPPDSSHVQTQINSARDAVKKAIDEGSIKPNKKPNFSNTPRVEFEACWFWVSNASWVDSNGQMQTGGVCAAGKTEYDRGRIVVSTKQQERTLALVRWEAANYYLMMIGRHDLTDSWQATH